MHNNQHNFSLKRENGENWGKWRKWIKESNSKCFSIYLLLSCWWHKAPTTRDLPKNKNKNLCTLMHAHTHIHLQLHMHIRLHTHTYSYTYMAMNGRQKTCAFKQVNKDLKGFGCQTHTHSPPTHTHAHTRWERKEEWVRERERKRQRYSEAHMYIYPLNQIKTQSNASDNKKKYTKNGCV